MSWSLALKPVDRTPALLRPWPPLPRLVRARADVCRTRGQRAHARGMHAEDRACAALERDGWTVLGRRLRTPCGEIDAAVERDGLLAFVEVKARPTLAEAAAAVTPRQRDRLFAAAEVLLADHPDWGRAGVRFDLLLVDAAGAVRRIKDAFRQE